MSRALTPQVKAALEQPPSADVARVIADVRPNFEGEEVLALQVILRKSAAPTRVGTAAGKRFTKIAAELRQRAVELGVDLFASVDFFSEDELPALKRLQTA